MDLAHLSSEPITEAGLNTFRRYSRDIAEMGETDTVIEVVLLSQMTWGFFWMFSVVEGYNGTVLLAQILLHIITDSVVPLYFYLEGAGPAHHTGKPSHTYRFREETFYSFRLF